MIKVINDLMFQTTSLFNLRCCGPWANPHQAHPFRIGASSHAAAMRLSDVEIRLSWRRSLIALLKNMRHKHIMSLDTAARSDMR